MFAGSLLQFLSQESAKGTLLFEPISVLREYMIYLVVIFPVVFWQPKVILTKWVPFTLSYLIYKELKENFCTIDPSGHAVKNILGVLVATDTANAVGPLRKFGSSFKLTAAWIIYGALLFHASITMLNTCYSYHTIPEAASGWLSAVSMVAFIDIVEFFLASRADDAKII